MSAAGMCNWVDDIFAEPRQRVRLARGESAEAERISVGEGGWAYGAGSQSEAAARSGGKIYRARMTCPMRTTSSDRKDAMVQLVTQLMQ